MAEALRTIISRPIEREYEAWIMSAIEEHLQELAIQYWAWAVHPNEESTWPADENLIVEGKVIALQFKQAILGATDQADPPYNRLYWSFHNPPGQWQLVRSYPSIYYCLPTFINRQWRGRALHHSLFWRPGPEDDRNAWYCNENARTPYRCIRDAARWGRFIEMIQGCEIGQQVAGAQDVLEYAGKVMSSYREMANLSVTSEETRSSIPQVVHFLYLQI